MSGILSPIAPAQLPPFLPVRQAATPVNGYPLLNSLGTILSWFAPADGQPHRFIIYAVEWISASMTGGEMDLIFSTPDNHAVTEILFAGDQTGPAYSPTQIARTLMCNPGTYVSIRQSAALTAGAATVFAEIWGS